MDLTDDERNLLLAGLYVLRITNALDGLDERREAIEALARRLGGDANTTFFTRPRAGTARPENPRGAHSWDPELT